MAECLLNSSAGHRPVSKLVFPLIVLDLRCWLTTVSLTSAGLIGFSFGARIILSCLKELARNQAIWERQQVGREVYGAVEGSQTMTSFRQSFTSMPYREAQVEFSREPASIVEDVILMGTPAVLNRTTWISCREVVGGRLVNCYSQKDMVLSLMYRVKNLGS